MRKYFVLGMALAGLLLCGVRNTSAQLSSTLVYSGSANSTLWNSYGFGNFTTSSLLAPSLSVPNTSPNNFWESGPYWENPPEKPNFTSPIWSNPTSGLGTNWTNPYPSPTEPQGRTVFSIAQSPWLGVELNPYATILDNPFNFTWKNPTPWQWFTGWSVAGGIQHYPYETAPQGEFSVGFSIGNFGIGGSIYDYRNIGQGFEFGRNTSMGVGVPLSSSGTLDPTSQSWIGYISPYIQNWNSGTISTANSTTPSYNNIVASFSVPVPSPPPPPVFYSEPTYTVTTPISAIISATPSPVLVAFPSEPEPTPTSPQITAVPTEPLPTTLTPPQLITPTPTISVIPEIPEDTIFIPPFKSPKSPPIRQPEVKPPCDDECTECKKKCWYIADEDEFYRCIFECDDRYYNCMNDYDDYEWLYDYGYYTYKDPAR